MREWLEAVLVLEPVSIVIIVIVALSLIQGMSRGAAGSARHLFYFIMDIAAMGISLLLASRAAALFSAPVQSWLQQRNIELPQGEPGALSQLWYTFVTGMRDFAMLRYGVLLLVSYLILRAVLNPLIPWLAALLFRLSPSDEPKRRGGRSRMLSRFSGALLGTLHGAGRGLVLMAVLFIYVSLLPQGPLSSEIRSSSLYQHTSSGLLEHAAGQVLAEQGPVFTKAVESEFKRILQRKYEIVDHAVPEEIETAAVHLTSKLDSDEEKARALYEWLGSRIEYDWDKANNYEERGIWKEQTPEETFRTRKGVCIDVARLYAMMARSSGLEVRVVTGLGADGRGGWGPHAWNEVQLAEGWVPLDATWYGAGDWFNPPDFDQTHIQEV